MLSRTFCCAAVRLEHVKLNVLLLPVVAGLHNPLVAAGPLDCCAQRDVERIISASIFIAPCYHLLSSPGLSAGAPYSILFPLPVVAGLFGPEVEAGPVEEPPDSSDFDCGGEGRFSSWTVRATKYARPATTRSSPAR